MAAYLGLVIYSSGITDFSVPAEVALELLATGVCWGSCCFDSAAAAAKTTAPIGFVFAFDPKPDKALDIKAVLGVVVVVVVAVVEVAADVAVK